MRFGRRRETLWRNTDQGKNLVWDRFYHRLTPSLQDALGFMMAELPKREQVGTSFDTLYILTKKMEAWQPSHLHSSGSGSSDTYRDKYRGYPAPTGWVAMLGEENCSHLTLNHQTLRCLSPMLSRG